MKKNLLKTLVVSCVTALMFMGCGAKTEDGANNINVKTILNNCANIFMYNCSIIFIRYFG